MRSYLRALLVLHRTYRAFPRGARIHILIRFLTAPFLRVLRFVPESAKTSLEIGGGHGAFSRLLADRGLRAFAVEPDLRKLARVENVRMIAGYDDCVRGSFDVVAILDVLYAIPIAQWDALLARVFDRVAPGGTLLIKEMDPAARLKNAWNRMQERISMRVLKITLAETFNVEAVEPFIARLEKHGFSDVHVEPVDFAYPHPHVLFVARKSATDGPRRSASPSA
jgi:2-polyprenyl-3-methyl-5-hydroxy-6-metoxy-1,4-benzoquinol methylase